MRAKMLYFAEHKDEFDAVYIGASRVFRGLDPVRIDAELAERGIELRSFNLALGGMLPFEQDYLLHEVLDMEPARLRWIFYEGGPMGAGLEDEHSSFALQPNLWSARGIQWHTASQTRKVLGAIRRLPVTLRRKLHLARVHVEIFGRRFGNLGQGKTVFRYWTESKEEREARAEIMAMARGEARLPVARGGAGARELRGDGRAARGSGALPRAHRGHPRRERDARGAERGPGGHLPRAAACRRAARRRADPLHLPRARGEPGAPAAARGGRRPDPLPLQRSGAIPRALPASRIASTRGT